MSKNTKETINAVVTATTTEAKEPLSKLIVTRSSFTTKEGEELYGYQINDKLLVNGVERPIRIDLTAKDIGGYEMLDIIFMLAEQAYLIVRDETMTDSKTNKKSTYRVYEVVNVDNYGIPYKYQVKPSAKSDEAMLNVLILQKEIFVENVEVVVDSALSTESTT